MRSCAVRLVPFEPGHLLRLAPGLPEREIFSRVDLPAFVGGYLAGGSAVPLIAGPGVLGCGGVVLAGAGPALAWVLLSDELRRRPVALHRRAARVLGALRARYGPLLATVDPGEAAAVRWIERLGFTFVDAVPGCGPRGETHWRYLKP